LKRDLTVQKDGANLAQIIQISSFHLLKNLQHRKIKSRKEKPYKLNSKCEDEKEFIMNFINHNIFLMRLLINLVYELIIFLMNSENQILDLSKTVPISQEEEKKLAAFL
jgi:hypothetical protein